MNQRALLSKVESIKQLRLNPGDILAIKCKKGLNAFERERLYRSLTVSFPGTKLLFYDESIDIIELAHGPQKD